MADLIISKEDVTPFVSFKENGKLHIEGRSLSEDPKKFYLRLFEWVNKLSVTKVDLISKIEYMNTASTKIFFDLLQAIENNKSIETINIEWHYEMDDFDMEEIGEMIESKLERSNFDYISCIDMEYV